MFNVLSGFFSIVQLLAMVAVIVYALRFRQTMPRASTLAMSGAGLHLVVTASHLALGQWHRAQASRHVDMMITFETMRVWYTVLGLLSTISVLLLLAAIFVERPIGSISKRSSSPGHEPMSETL